MQSIHNILVESGLVVIEDGFVAQSPDFLVFADCKVFKINRMTRKKDSPEDVRGYLRGVLRQTNVKGGRSSGPLRIFDYSVVTSGLRPSRRRSIFLARRRLSERGPKVLSRRRCIFLAATANAASMSVASLDATRDPRRLG